MFNALIVQPFGWLLRQCYNLLGSYGLAIIVFTILSKIIMLPFQMKSKKSMLEMNRLQPKLKELEAKYKDDKERYSLEVQKLYKKEGVSMFGGCLPLLITLPIMIGLYNVVRQPLTHIFGLSADTIAQIANALIENGVAGIEHKTGFMLEVAIASNLGKFKDIIVPFAENLKDVSFSFLGLDLSEIPNFKYITPMWIIPALSGVSAWFSGWLMRRAQGKQVTEQAAQTNSMMNFLMPLMSVWIAFAVPAGLGLYWIVSNILTAVQEPILTAYYKNKAAKKEKKETTKNGK